eukprot:CAMPEP_0170466108 /NCGR_PEP_ID=MMETSP0123-20130129/10196_1 /TAXON_ID=182087 /ORGANISM="Favella ehrenbergii, Strain Fehren 1" /LENGTH=184 /DNA_ID=CAMNT_0010732163 /DNA_START=234 /DNA_END=788 /DNA_ORIENTATION=+
MILERAVGVASGLVEEHADPVASTHAWNLAHVLNAAAALTHVELAPLLHCNRLSFSLHEVFIHAVTLLILECCVAGILHALLERSDGVVALAVGLFANLVLLDLADVVELVGDGAATLVNDVHGEAFLWAVLAQRLHWVHQVAHDLPLPVLELQAHVGWVRAELPLEELLALSDVPVEVEAQLR